ncbi:MAG: hypothetical protein HY331_17510 [Chloroflexi bacterium]|nr:hypothetical protein [Chloroflexota bacterium]
MVNKLTEDAERIFHLLPPGTPVDPVEAHRELAAAIAARDAKRASELRIRGIHSAQKAIVERLLPERPSFNKP